MPRTVLDVHILQTLPPNSANRDDVGSPKTAVYGGVLRSRVSSQAWKRATRTVFADVLDSSELGVRTKRAVAAVVERVIELDASITPDAAASAAAELLREATGVKFDVPKQRKNAEKAAESEREDAQRLPESSYLLFLSARQLDKLAAIALRAAKDPSLLKGKEIKKQAREAADTEHSVDIALFGRMVADTKDFNVEAACQVAHAISVHSVENESDYFTALDERRTDAEPGAGMIGVSDFNASTLYRYAALDIGRLADNLGSGGHERTAEPTRRAVEAFLEAFIISLPSGKQNSFAHQTLPEVVIVKLRTARPISFATAFEEPVLADVETGGYLRNACARLAKFIPEIERTYDAQEGTETWMLRIGTATDVLEPCGKTVSIRKLLDNVGRAVTDRLSATQ